MLEAARGQEAGIEDLIKALASRLSVAPEAFEGALFQRMLREALEGAERDLKGLPPVERKNWGIPSVIYGAYNNSPKMHTARKRFVGFVEEAELTCVQVADMAVAEYGFDIPLLRKAGERKLTYDLVTQAIVEEERRYSRELESWSNGNDAVSRSINMGNLVQGLISWEEDPDARPRPEMCEVPLSESALGDFED